MHIESKLFNGAKLNTDDAIEYQAPTDLLGGVNVRLQNYENGRQGYVVVVEGTQIIERTLPTGNNKVIGAKTINGRTFIFLYNSEGYHRIEEYNAETGNITLILRNRTEQTGGLNILGWTDKLYIKDILIVQNEYLYWNEYPNDSIKRIHIDRAVSGEYGVIKRDDLHIGFKAPKYSPYFDYVTDMNISVNNLRKNLFQFRYRYKYKGESSIWSAISPRSLPVGEHHRLDTNVFFNAIKLYIPLDPDYRYDSIEIAMNIAGSSEWYLIREATKEEMDNAPFDVNEIPDPEEEENENLPLPSPLPAFRFLGINDKPGGFGITFYNEGVYPATDLLEQEQLYDGIPMKTRAIEVVNDNTVLLGNNRMGYNKISGVKLKATVDYETVNFGDEEERPDKIKARVDTETVGTGMSEQTIFKIILEGEPKVGDELTVYVSGVFAGLPPYLGPVVVVAGMDNNKTAVANAISDLFPTSYTVSKTVTTVGNTVVIEVKPLMKAWLSSVTPYYTIKSIFISGEELERNKSIPSIKLGSSYATALAVYDKNGVPFGIIEGDVVSTKTFTEVYGNSPIIRWTIEGNLPPEAHHYSILTSTNQTHEKSIYTLGLLHEEEESSEGGFIWLDITSLEEFNKNVANDNLEWTYLGGDKLSVIGGFTDDGADPVLEVVEGDALVLDILGYKIKMVTSGDEEIPLTLIKIPIPNPDIIQFIANRAYLLEIYRPKKRAGNEAIYFENSPLYLVSGGVPSVTSGDIRYIDSFIKKRYIEYKTRGSVLNQGFVFTMVEGFHFSDYYKSDYHNGGRPRAVGDVPENTWFKSEIRYSREWVSGSKVNNINRFYPEDVYDSREPFYGAVETYGGIQYLSVRENRLLCLQEFKIGYIPINRSIIEDNEEMQQVAISSKLLNPISYSIGKNYGIGDSVMIPSYQFINGMAYFVDPNNLCVVRAGVDGVRDINSTYSSYLRNLIINVKDNGLKVLGLWDDRFQEYHLVIDDHTEIYNETIDGWTPIRSISPENGFSVNRTFYTCDKGRLYGHTDIVDVANFYGVQHGASIEFAVTSPKVKTYNTLAVHADTIIPTSTNGIKTQLGHVSDLYEQDFTRREGINYAQFYRDKNTDLLNGDRLKGRWISIKLEQKQPENQWNILKVDVKAGVSTLNE